MSSPQSYDPRRGDEDLPITAEEDHSGIHKVRLQDKESGSQSQGAEHGDDTKKKASKSILDLPQSLKWISTNLTWSKLKPVIRCSVVGWVCLLLVIIPQTSKILGPANFLILIAAFIAPPSDPFVSVLEREIIQILFVTVTWAWCYLAMLLGNLARTTTDLTATPAAIYNGDFLEAAPTAIMAVFLFVGSAILLYIKARQGPSPFLFGCVFGCICIDISITTAILFPYSYYQIGQAIVVPVAIKGAISLLASAILFPSTICSLYTNRCHAVVTPLISMLSEHRRLLKMTTCDSEFSPANVNRLLSLSEAAIAPVAASIHLLKRDIVWSRVSPADFVKLHLWARRLVVGANGMSVYFSLIDPTREHFPATPAPSHPATPVGMTPFHSRPPSTHHEDLEEDVPSQAEQGTRNAILESPDSEEQLEVKTNLRIPHINSARFARRRNHSHIPRFLVHSIHDEKAHERHHLHPGQQVSHGSPLHLALTHTISTPQLAVGVFESYRYVDFESKHLYHPDNARHTESFHSLLGDSCDELLETSSEVLTGINAWLDSILIRRVFYFWRNKGGVEKLRQGRLAEYEKLKQKLDEVLERFRRDKRHLVIDPYRSGPDTASPIGEGQPSHRHLFHCYIYQYHLIQFCVLLSQLMEEIIRLEKEGKKSRLWMPMMPLRKIFSWNTWQPTDEMDRDYDEDPDIIPGMEPEWMTDLGSARQRDPDALPPRNGFEWVMNVIYRALSGLSRGNALYALKAGLLTIVLAIPNFIQSSSLFSYQNKFVWGIIMGQLTLVRFRGDTTFGLVSRIVSTFSGGLVGTVLWYISTGTGHGNAYGLAAVCGVCFPFFFYGRLYWPGPPMTNIIFFVTIVLVICYSWIDTHPQSTFSFSHWGIDLAIRRFVLVTAGVTAAFIFSFLPPSTTLRAYQRNSLSTTSGEIGAIYCSIVSYANTRKHIDAELQEIVQSLIAIRLKLRRSIVLKENVIYEFSLRGRWPAKRYHTIVEIQFKISYLLSHLMSVVEHLEPAWSRAFLRRSRFLDADFQGEVLAVISMISTSLRTGTPLPQITPCPLLDRFLRYSHGLNISREEADGEYGLSKTMTIDTLENEQYLFFCVGITTAFGIINQLDRLMVATKELVGEQYHIHGIGLSQRGGEDRPSKRFSDTRPAKDV